MYELLKHWQVENEHNFEWPEENTYNAGKVLILYGQWSYASYSFGFVGWSSYFL